MNDNLEIDFDDVLLEDDASRYKETLSFEQRKALYHHNGLEEPTEPLSDEQKSIVDDFMSPNRPGFLEAIKGVLK